MIKEKQNSSELRSVLDPGYLMLAVYVLGVTFLVMFAWFGGNSTALDGEQQGKAGVVAHKLTEQSVITRHFIKDQG